MAKPNFHDRSWQDIDWETWGSQFSIVDRASSVGELQNGITTRYITNQLTLTDERLYTQPITVTSSLKWSPETPIMEYSCSEGIYDQHLQEKYIKGNKI